MDPHRRAQLERALRFVGEHLDRPILAAEVARAAGWSEFHFHRVFHAEVGESIGRFITRRRLELAALRLAYEPDRSVTDVALSSGYSSPSNFSKAFAAHFGCTPTQVREARVDRPAALDELTRRHGRDLRPEALQSLAPGRTRDERRREAATWNGRVRYESTDGRSFACLAGPGGYDPDDIGRTWVELIERARQLGLVDGAVDAWGVPHDSPDVTAPERCRYHACIPCPVGFPLPAPLFAGRQRPGRYAVFRYDGAASGVGTAYRSVYSCWFPESSLAPADFEPLDRYVGDFPRDGRVEVELWVRVRPRRG